MPLRENSERLFDAFCCVRWHTTLAKGEKAENLHKMHPNSEQWVILLKIHRHPYRYLLVALARDSPGCSSFIEDIESGGN